MATLTINVFDTSDLKTQAALPVASNTMNVKILRYRESPDLQREIPLSLGGLLCIVGRNGAGKSTLLTQLQYDNLACQKRIWASRANVFQQNDPTISSPPDQNVQFQLLHQTRK
jgi:ABC-type lipoprotein export system ATPase subunit